jgi:D-glycero-alpha-D-manno-heptose-7-phosphate kinase
MYTYLGEPKPPEVLAEQACEIEVDILGKPIGKQDQYIAAFGNLRLIQFLTDGQVKVNHVDMDPQKKRRFSESLMLFYTGVTRKADMVLTEQKKNIADRMTVLRRMRQQAYEIHELLLNGKADEVGSALHEGWLYKKQLAAKISNSSIDDMYDKAMSAGAIGGKVAGAGGGGFMMVYCPPERQQAVRNALSDMMELPFNLERDGTKVIFNIRR